MIKKIIFFQIFFVLATVFISSSFALIKFEKNPEVPNITYPALKNKSNSVSKESQSIITYFDSKKNKLSSAPFEEYIKGVVCAEMPASYETEALKAQAVAARSYILFKTNHPSADHPNAAVCTNPAHCKGYVSKEQAEEKFGKNLMKKYYTKISEAVEKTKGEYLCYEGETVEAFFFALSNGKTENSEDVWQAEVPYLKSTESEGDKTSPNFVSEAKFSVEDFNKKLKTLSTDFVPKKIPEFSDITKSSGGRTKSLKINDTYFSGTDIRSAFSLKSTDFSVEVQNKNIVFTVKGNGHGVGMSQYGANYLAKEGKTYEEILKHYYSGVEIINKQQ